MSNECGVMLGEAAVHDEHGCYLPDGHHGPHEFKDVQGCIWNWETDFSCRCEHCLKVQGDYCTTIWKKNTRTKV